MARRDMGGQTVGKAADNGQLLRVHCGLCRTHKWFHPDDVAQLFGRRVQIERLSDRITCAGCGKRTYLNAVAVYTTAQEKAAVIVRRLKRVYTVRRVEWEDRRL